MTRQEQQKAYKVELYRKRREAGLCQQCGQPALPGKTKCQACVDKNQALQKKRYDTRKAAGICPNCREPAMPGHTVCAKCSKKAENAALERYYRNKGAGVCRQCGADAGGASLCNRCKANAAEDKKHIYEGHKTRGTCASCGKQPAVTGKTTCATCAERQSKANCERLQRLRDAAFAAYGGPVCAGCGYDNREVLELDHIDGGGNKHRKEIGQGQTFDWLAKNGYPPGYRVLCPTCNKLSHKGLLKLTPESAQE